MSAARGGRSVLIGDAERGRGSSGDAIPPGEALGLPQAAGEALGLMQAADPGADPREALGLAQAAAPLETEQRLLLLASLAPARATWMAWASCEIMPSSRLAWPKASCLRCRIMDRKSRSTYRV